jgi:hypothetical protein
MTKPQRFSLSPRGPVSALRYRFFFVHYENFRSALSGKKAENMHGKIGSSRIAIWLEPFVDLARARKTYGSSHISCCSVRLLF